MLKKFVFKTFSVAVLFSVLVAILLSVISICVKNRGFKNSQTESNTLIIESDKKYDLLFMGISHARNFSRYGNHEIVEGILDKKIINIGQGSGKCGINEQLYYLYYFFKKNNQVKKVCLVLTPPMLTSENLPVASNTFEQEMFKLDFLLNYLFFDSENKSERIIQYIQSKCKNQWLYLKPDLTQRNDTKLQKIDKKVIEEGMQIAHGKSINQERFNASCSVVRDIVKSSRERGAEIILIIPPALFGKWPEHKWVLEFCEKLKKQQHVEYYDFSETVLNPSYYYDHHHLNTEGVVYFTKTFLKEVL